MSSTPWILISVGILVVLLGIVAYFSTKNKKRKKDYFSIFIIGLIWFVIGIPSKSYFFIIVGAFYLVWGVAHRKEWKKNRFDWGKLSKKQKKWQIALTIGLAALLVAITCVLVLVQ